MNDNMKMPLKGLKVVDFAWYLAGAMTTKTLSDYGADVIRIESTSHPDALREQLPSKDGIIGINRGGRFNWLNTGKLSLTVNITRPEGIEVVKKLVAKADIVVENFASGVMKKLGLDYEELRKIKPDIIMLSTCMQGQTGPHAQHPGFGMQLSALAGLVNASGWPDRAPIYIGAPTDYIVPRYGTMAILAALAYRRRTGRGQYIEISQYEVSIHFMTASILDYTANHRIAGREGNRLSYAAPHGAYRCLGKDRWCAIAVFTDEEWQSFGKVLKNPAWFKDPKFATLQARKENEDELDKLVEEWTLNYSPEEIMTLLQKEGVAAGVLENAEDMLDHDPHLRYRGFFWEVDHPEIGKYRTARPPFLLSNCNYEIRRAPLIGEHNEYVLREIIGMPDEEITHLVLADILQ